MSKDEVKVGLNLKLIEEIEETSVVKEDATPVFSIEDSEPKIKLLYPVDQSEHVDPFTYAANVEKAIAMDLIQNFEEIASSGKDSLEVIASHVTKSNGIITKEVRIHLRELVYNNIRLINDRIHMNILSYNNQDKEYHKFNYDFIEELDHIIALYAKEFPTNQLCMRMIYELSNYPDPKMDNDINYKISDLGLHLTADLYDLICRYMFRKGYSPEETSGHMMKVNEALLSLCEGVIVLQKWISDRFAIFYSPTVLTYMKMISYNNEINSEYGKFTSFSDMVDKDL